MKIKVITIDFWNTLFDSSNGLKRNAARQHVFAGEIAKLDVKISNEEFQNGVKASWDFFNNIWTKQHRTPATIETIEFLWDNLNLPPNYESINIVAKSFAESIIDYPPKLMDGVMNTLEKLKENQYKIGLISDTGFTPGVILKKVMENAGVLKYFDTFSFSDETGVSKPDNRAFNTILEQLNVTPQEALHIGDIEKTDIIGAKQIGMYAIRFSGDETAVLNKNNPKVTIADAEIFHWNDFIPALDSINI